jgi:ATP-dependent DNA ligase
MCFGKNPRLATARDATLAVMPTHARFIEPMLLLRSADLPDGGDWLIELKLDGYRAIELTDAAILADFPHR